MSVPESGITTYLPDEPATAALGRLLAPFLLPGRALLLYGDLGMGKSSLARAVVQALAPDVADVPSPTFTLMLSYDVSSGGEPVTCWHVDLYRIESVSELAELGLEELMESAITLIEWPERLEGDLPKDYISCHFTIAPDGVGRMVTIHLSASLHSLGPELTNAVTFRR